MRGDAGLSLTEMVIVVALLGVALGVVFTAVQVLMRSANTITDNGTASNDLSDTMQLLSKGLMDGKVLYADDNRIVVLNHLNDGSYELSSVLASGTPGPDGTGGQLVWERWSTDASATAPAAGSSPSRWVMSERNANLATATPIPLFSYYRDATDASVMSVSSGEKATVSDASLANFVGVLPGGYTVSAIGRIRLHVATSSSGGIRDDSRDITLRVRG